MLNLYLITRKATARSVGYDEYDSFVVATPDAATAMNTHPRGKPTPFDRWEYDWVLPDDTNQQYLGKADSSIQPGVICASFNAG